MENVLLCYRHTSSDVLQRHQSHISSLHIMKTHKEKVFRCHHCGYRAWLYHFFFCSVANFKLPKIQQTSQGWNWHFSWKAEPTSLFSANCWQWFSKLYQVTILLLVWITASSLRVKDFHSCSTRKPFLHVSMFQYCFKGDTTFTMLHQLHASGLTATFLILRCFVATEISFHFYPHFSQCVLHNYSNFSLIMEFD